MIRRRFLNIVAEKRVCGSYSLHRLDASKHLFYPSMAEAEAANKNNNGNTCSLPLPQLPPPVVSFEPYSATPTPTPLWKSLRLQGFALISPRSGDGEDRILCINTVGDTIVYNADSGTIQTIPPLNGGKGFMPIVMSIPRPAAGAGAGAAPGEEGEDIYVMRSIGHRHSSFDVLRFDGHRIGYWAWDRLPPPLPTSTCICSHTVVDGGSTICVSAVPTSSSYRSERVTYYFDLVKCEWRQAGGGGWVLPFEERAEYVPELNLWLGFSKDEGMRLCAWDLSAMDEPPRLLHAWTDLETAHDPEEWSVTGSVSLIWDQASSALPRCSDLEENLTRRCLRIGLLSSLALRWWLRRRTEEEVRQSSKGGSGWSGTSLCDTCSEKRSSGGCCRSVRVCVP